MEETVASMLITTPLRRPREGWVPMPITSMPSGVTSPTMQQIFVVPMSSPTISSPFFCAMSPLSLSMRRRLQLGRDPLRPRFVVQIDARGMLSAAGERGAQLQQPAQLERNVAGTQPHLLHAGGLARDDGEAAVLLQTHLFELSRRQSLAA